MGVTFILGRTASKRDERVIEKIRDIAAKDPLADVLVVVPPQSTYITEKQLMRALRAKGLMGVCVQSPARVIDRVLESTYGRVVKSVDTAGKSMMLRRILDANQGELAALAQCAKRGDIPLEMAGLISEFKTLDITPEMLREIETGHVNTQKKFEDIAFLYERFEEESEGIFDTEDRINMVIDHIPEAEFLKNTHLVVHGFDIYNAQTVRFIKALMRAAKDTVMSFYYADGSAPDAEMYGICDENRNKFLADAMAMGLETEIVTEDRAISPDILHIEKNLYAYPPQRKAGAKDLSVTRASTVDEEVRAVMAQAVWLNQKYGYRWRDMAVCCGSAERYVPMIAQRFSEAGIPCFAGEKRTLDQCAFSMFLLTAFALSGGRLKKDTLIAHAKTGFCNLSEKQVCALQNYAFSNVRDGFAFTFPFRDEEAELARAALMEPVMKLREQAKGADSAERLIACVLEYMKGLSAEKKLNAQNIRAQRAGLYESAEWNAQVYEKTMRILSQAQEILKDTPMDRGQLLSLLQTGFAAQKVGVIPPGADEVAVGEISYIRLDEVKAVFVLGLNDGILPNYEQTSDLLADYERELILSQAAGLQYTGNVEKQKLAILKTFTRPSEKLFLSYVDDGREKPSPLLDRVFEIFGEIRKNEAADLLPMLKQNAYLMTAHSLRAYGSGLRADVPAPVAAAVLNDEEFPQKRRAVIWGTQNANAARPLTGELAAALYGEMKGSASRLEQYYECPYKHFIAYGLNVAPPREYTIDPLDVGNYAHKILETLTKKIQEENMRWADIPQEEFDGLFGFSARAAREEQNKYTLNKHNEAVLDAVEEEVRLAAQAIRLQTGQSLLQPLMSEHFFSQEFADGLVVNGKIDRIDAAELDGALYFDIVDYKTGEPHFSLRSLAGGLSLQLMIYIIAAAEVLGENAEFAGANYFRIHLPSFTEEGKKPEEDFGMEGVCGVDFDTAQKLYGGGENTVLTISLSRKKDGEIAKSARDKLFSREEIGLLVGFTRKLIARAAGEMKTGGTRIHPYLMDGKTGCDYCDFSAVCMYEEGYAGNRPRVIEKMDRERALDEMRGEEGLS